MERPKLKLTVILLLALLNLFLLGLVLSQNQESRSYEREGQSQALVYLERHGLAVEEDTIPWEGKLQDSKSDPRSLLLEGEDIPTSAWEIQTMRQPETLLVDLVRGLEELDAACSAVVSITEGYRATSDGVRTVLTPVWVVETDGGTYYLDCAAGQVIDQT